MLTLGLLVLVPGDALYRLVFPPIPPVRCPSYAPGPGERIFLRLLGGTLLTGWWAIVLAEAGAFAARGVTIAVGTTSVVLYALAWRAGGRPSLAPARPRPTATGLALGAIVILAAGLSFGRPFETIVGAEDAGIYFNSGGTIARHGRILLPDAGLAGFGDAAASAESEGAARHVLLPLGKQDRYLFAEWQRLSGFFLLPGEPNTVTPQFLHLFPTWLALWATFGGGAGAMVYGGPAFGLLGVVAAHFLARRLFGPGVGLLAALLLTLNGLQLWFVRESLSEPLLQFLLLGALAAWALFVEARDAGDGATARGAALLSGLALGSVALAHAQFLFALLPLVPLVGWLWLGQRWRKVYWWFFIPLAALLGHAAFHIVRYALGYFEGIYHHIWLNAWRDRGQTLLLLLAPLAMLALLDRTRCRWLPALRDRAVRRRGRWAAAAAVALGATWLYLIRPGILHPATLQGYIGAPVPATAATSLVSLGWYFSPLGIALAVAGLLVLILCDLDERALAVLGLAAPFMVLYLSGTYTQGGYIYSLRRFVPLIVPVASILIAYAAIHAAPALAGTFGRSRLERPLRALGLAATGLLVLFFVYTNARLIRHREYDGLLSQVQALAGTFGPDDLLLFSGPRDEAPKLATPLHYLFGRESWVITTNLPSGDLLDAWIAGQEAAGRRVHILMSANGGKVLLPGHRLEPTGTIDVTLRQFETLENQKPYNLQRNALHYSHYSPREVGSGESPLGALPYRVQAGCFDEPAQVSGFHNLEPAGARCAREGGAVYRWTDGQALLRVPWPGDGRPLVLRLMLGSGPRPAALPPAQVIVGLKPDAGSDARGLTTLTVGADFAEYTIAIPAGVLGPTPDGTAVVSLAVPCQERACGSTWRPVDWPVEGGNSPDRRALHVRFAGAILTGGEE